MDSSTATFNLSHNFFPHTITVRSLFSASLPSFTAPSILFPTQSAPQQTIFCPLWMTFHHSGTGSFPPITTLYSEWRPIAQSAEMVNLQITPRIIFGRELSVSPPLRPPAASRIKMIFIITLRAAISVIPANLMTMVTGHAVMLSIYQQITNQHMITRAVLLTDSHYVRQYR